MTAPHKTAAAAHNTAATAPGKAGHSTNGSVTRRWLNIKASATCSSGCQVHVTVTACQQFVKMPVDAQILPLRGIDKGLAIEGQPSATTGQHKTARRGGEGHFPARGIFMTKIEVGADGCLRQGPPVQTRRDGRLGVGRYLELALDQQQRVRH